MAHLIVKAPARICLFGDHQDYLGLPVIACAIDRYVTLEATRTDSDVLSIYMPDIGEHRIIPIRMPFQPISDHDYFISALHVVKRIGCTPKIGYSIEIKGDIPINAGLSSSSALVVAWVAFLLKAFGCSQTVTKELIAHLAYTAEVLEYNGPGGLMDPYTISLGNTIFLDTVSGAYTKIPKTINSLIIGESGVPKKTLNILKKLRNYAQESIASIKAHVPDFQIRNAEMEAYNRYHKYVSDELKPIFYAALKNYSITKNALEEFQKDYLDVAKIGALMTDHHLVLRDILKISVPSIDRMVESALRAGALGAKIVGSGGGGCMVALANADHEEKVIQSILEGGGKAAYKINISKGIHIIQNAY